MTTVYCNEQWCRWNRSGKWCIAKKVSIKNKNGQMVCETKEMFYEERV